MVNFTDLGMGTFSCATAEQSDNFVYSEQWLAGYFGGVNVNNNLDHNVGSGTDMAGIMGEVQLECSAYPSEHFSKAVGNVYNKLQQEGR